MHKFIPLTIYDIIGTLQKYRLVELRQLGRISGIDVKPEGAPNPPFRAT